MPDDPASFRDFVGRAGERQQFRRTLERRSGGHLGFVGIGGIGKSRLLQQLAADARRLGITPYIVELDMLGAVLEPRGAARPITSPLDLLLAILHGLAPRAAAPAATGRQ